MPQISGTNERFLQTPVILSEIMRVMEPNLKFVEVIPMVDSGGMPVTYASKGSASGDAFKQTPAIHTASAKFPEVEITRMTKSTALLNKEGLAVRIDEDALRLPAGKDMIMDAFQRAGYWIAEAVNSSIYSVIDGGSTDSGITVSGDWGSSADATPFEDLRNFKNAMKREGYPYRMTDIFLEMDNFDELEGYLANADITDTQRNMIYGKPVLNQDTIQIPLIGTVHGLFSSITHGDFLGVDRNNPAAACFYWNDPKYSTASISYETVENGKRTTKTVPNFGLSTHQFFENDTHDTVIQLWVDNVTVVKDAYGIISENGI